MRLAKEGSCVIVGRCADFILRDIADCLSVFIHASDEKRAERIVSVYGQREEAPANRLHNKDRKRRAYYELYTGTSWGDIANYTVCLYINTNRKEPVTVNVIGSCCFSSRRASL